MRSRKLLSALSLSSLIWLTLVWCLLWGDFSLGNIVFGALIAFGVNVAFYLPPVSSSGRFSIVGMVVLLASLLWDMFVSSVQVAILVVQPRRKLTNSIIAVQLQSRSDLILSLTAEVFSLTPGTLVIEVNRAESIIYVHALNTRTLDDVDRIKSKALGWERKLIVALGSREDLATLRPDPAVDPQRKEPA